MDGDVSAFRVLHPPFVRVGIAAEGKFEPVSFEDEAHRAIKRMDRREAPDGNAVLFVDDLLDARVVELGEFDLEPAGVHVSLP